MFFLNANNAVTYTLNGGRFGDNLISCSQAYWIHYTYGLPLLFQPFTYSEQLHIHYQYPHFNEQERKKFNKFVYIKPNTPINTDNQKSTLYITTFKQDPGVDWSNQQFLQTFKQAISLVQKDSNIQQISSTTHSIAMHIRRGGSFAYDKKMHTVVPQQFPSLEFYSQSLQLLLHHLDGICTVYLFTDDSHPKSLAKQLYKTLSAPDKKRVTFIYRKKNNSHAANVLTDFFSMMHCKYLIRPCSHFSLFVEQLGNAIVSIYPAKTYAIKKGWGYVTHMGITIFVEGASYEQIVHIENLKTNKNISILQNNELKSAMHHAHYHIKNKQLKPNLPPCY
jgi:hypothetical protein